MSNVNDIKKYLGWVKMSDKNGKHTLADTNTYMHISISPYEFPYAHTYVYAHKHAYIPHAYTYTYLRRSVYAL